MSSVIRRKVDLLRARNKSLGARDQELPWQTRLRYSSYFAGLASVYMTVFQVDWGDDTVFATLRDWHDDKLFEWFGYLRPGDQWEYVDSTEPPSP